jgi:hypothetical protein
MSVRLGNCQPFTRHSGTRARLADPESRNRLTACVWIPAFAPSVRPGMTRIPNTKKGRAGRASREPGARAKPRARALLRPESPGREGRRAGLSRRRANRAWNGTSPPQRPQPFCCGLGCPLARILPFSTKTLPFCPTDDSTLIAPLALSTVTVTRDLSFRRSST